MNQIEEAKPKFTSISKSRGVYQDSTTTYNEVGFTYNGTGVYGGGDSSGDVGLGIAPLFVSRTSGVFQESTTQYSDPSVTWSSSSATWGGGGNMTDAGPVMITAKEIKP